MQSLLLDKLICKGDHCRSGEATFNPKAQLSMHSVIIIIVTCFTSKAAGHAHARRKWTKGCAAQGCAAQGQLSPLSVTFASVTLPQHVKRCQNFVICKRWPSIDSSISGSLRALKRTYLVYPSPILNTKPALKPYITTKPPVLSRDLQP